MENKQNLFAFKLASDTQASSLQTANKDARQAGDGKWKAREGAAAAGGCSDYLFPGNLRYDSWWWGQDQGDWC